MALGYHNLPELTAERFLRVGPGDNEQLAYMTGDCASYRRDGTVDFYGRNDNQVKIRGFRIELGEIEAALVALSAVREASASVETLIADEPQLVAYIVFAGEEEVTTTELRKALRASLPDYMVPSLFTELNELPKTPNGKVDRIALSMSSARTVKSGQEYRAAENEEEKFIVELWSQLLEVDNISANDNFFDLGGHSLLAMRCAMKVEEETGFELNPRELFFRSASQVAKLLH